METKVCPKCGTTKELTEFYVMRAAKSGRSAACKECILNTYHRSERGQAVKKAYYVQNRYKFVSAGLKFKYKFDLRELERRVKAQKNRCAICLRITEQFQVDHDNSCCDLAVIRKRGTCGKCVRGLLCKSCNTALGAFHDDLAALSRAIRYLKQHRKLLTASL